MTEQVNSDREPKKAGQGGTCYGTVLFAEKNDLASSADILAEAGFHLKNLSAAKDKSPVFEPVFFLVDSAGWKQSAHKIREFITHAHSQCPLIMIDDGDYGDQAPQLPNALLAPDYTGKQLLTALREAYRSCTLNKEIERIQGLLDSGHTDSQKLIEIGISLSSERNIDKLLEKILTEACKLTGADAGSIYIIDVNEKGENILRFRNTIGFSLKIDFKEFTIPIGPDSIAGYVALTGEPLIIDDCYSISEQYPFSINRSFDESNNYRTKSMLAVAMRNQKEEITGVIQLINRKPKLDLVLSSPDIAEKMVIPFDERTHDLINALASQAAVSLENYRLYRDIENLFEGFVQASVTAIESRDPTTCGHSERVATLTTGIAEQVNRTTTGPLKDVTLSEIQLKEIRYAALLHDFGKVGVRENVLLKSKKLYPDHLEIIRKRFDLARQIYRNETSHSKIEQMLSKSQDEYLSIFKDADKELQGHLDLLDEYLQLILTSNEPKVLASDSSKLLDEITKIIIGADDIHQFRLLEDEELGFLTIPKGSLSAEERVEIESHVTHTFNFLSKIPWTRELGNIPNIAYGHHENLAGGGYPRRLKDPDICIQTRMMTIADIYDALSAQDRPYKPALPVEKSLDILRWEARDGKLDSDLVDIFIEGKVYELTQG
ncbi:MAG: HD domain-containing phosphohydrolase [Gemmatimonadota bacterium]|nr:HD domain-containing phosphohydrolase [Gemmatimonadota bacterium]